MVTSIRRQFREITACLNRIDFEAIWHGFHPYPFALYTRREAVMDGECFPTPDNFYGNTTVRFGGRQIAIWDTEHSPRNPEALTAGLVHEMFHAFQMEMGEQRIPDDLALFAAELTPELLAWRIWERQLLAGEDTFSQFFAARLAHRNDCLTREEEQMETLEGMAQFAELQALAQLSAISAAEALEQCRARLQNAKLAADIRSCGYDSGAYMLQRAANAGIKIGHTIGLETAPVFGVLLRQLSAVPEAIRPPASITKTAAEILHAQTQRRQAEAEAFCKAAHCQGNGPYQICGYDPMNMWRQDTILFSRGFILLKNAAGETQSVHGCALFHMKSGTADTVTDFWTP